ncbi:hypothetical protein [Pseudomarimonas salicorniae]|uniref:Uncharacterized protein n=1 Tax=Pseudomarimonas salicorniae TaxID=2933270 RepID=A0ABT0GEE8_9GAMM|nr:hypothetical protein [Lysobacter sp. CAU 1642]MCK7592925.1 hypothetical protein [Lysobacter sp. CAU 1642]
MSLATMTASRGRWLALACALGGLLAQGPAHALPPGLDGSWFDPAHPGHGLTVERIDAGRALVFWHAFDTHGRPLTLYIEARVEGDTLRGEALAPQGMRFGVFDPQTLQLPEWGEVNLQFSDCRTALLRWRGLDSEYGEGQATLQRLLPLSDSACSLAAPAGLPGMDGYRVSGYLNGDFTVEGQGGPKRSLWVSGHVDPEGVLRATVEPFPGAHLSDTPVLIGEPLPSASGRAELQVRYLRNRLGDLLDQAFGDPVSTVEGGAFPLQLKTRSEPRGAAAYDYTGRVHGVDEIDIRVEPWSRERVRFGIYGDPANGELQIRSDGTLCLRILGDPPSTTCRFSGRMLSQGEASFRFELQETGRGQPPFIGTGVGHDSAEGGWPMTSVKMIGDNGVEGFYYESNRFVPTGG